MDTITTMKLRQFRLCLLKQSMLCLMFGYIISCQLMLLFLIGIYLLLLNSIYHSILRNLMKIFSMKLLITDKKKLFTCFSFTSSKVPPTISPSKCTPSITFVNDFLCKEDSQSCFNTIKY